jgi:energy-coupling factor transporter ATP-binding protein EcfA2
MNTILKTTSLALAGAFCVLAMLAALALYVVNVAGPELADSTRLVIVSGGWAVAVALGAVALACLAYGVFRAMSAAEAWLAARAARRVIEAQAAAAMRDARVTTITAPADHQVFISDDRPAAAPFVAAHLPSGASQFEALAWAEWNRIHGKPAARIAAPPPPAALPAGPGPALLDAIAHLPNLLIVGGKGTGKTTLLQHLAALRAAAGRVLIFDSHDFPSKWPAGDVIGNGRNYANIWRAMLALLTQLQKRFEDLSIGKVAERGHDPVVTIIDEFTLLPKVFKGQGINIQQFSIPILTEGRKVALDTVWGIHSDRAAALGLEGAKDLVECFDAVVYLKNVAGRRYALVDFGAGKTDVEYSLPGPFVVPGQIGPGDVATGPIGWTVAPEPEPSDVAAAPERPTAEDEAIIFHYVDLRDNDRANFSYNEVARRSIGSAGGWQTQKIKDVLQKWGIQPI